MIIGGLLAALGVLILAAVVSEFRASRASERWLAKKWATTQVTEHPQEQRSSG